MNKWTESQARISIFPWCLVSSVKTGACLESVSVCSSHIHKFSTNGCCDGYLLEELSIGSTNGNVELPGKCFIKKKKKESKSFLDWGGLIWSAHYELYFESRMNLWISVSNSTAYLGQSKYVLSAVRFLVQRSFLMCCVMYLWENTNSW